MEFAEVVKAVADYGALIMLAALALYVIIRLVNLGFKYLDKKVSAKNHDELIDVRHTVGESVQNLISEYLRIHHSERVNVVEFSNSVMSVAYLPFKYMTCTYEAYTLGEHSIAASIDKLPTSLFINFFKVMYDEGHVVLDPSCPDEALGGTIYEVLCHNPLYQVLCMPMRTVKGKVIGYVAVDSDAKFTSTDFQDLKALADKVCALLSVADR